MRRTLLLLCTMALALLLAGAPALAAPTDESDLCQNPQRVLQDVTEIGGTNIDADENTSFVVNLPPW
jgi:hypothetical protein